MSCKDSGSPESITELFLISLNTLDYTTLNNISTRSTRDLFKIMKKISEDKITEEEIEKRADNLKIKIIGSTIEGDTLAYVTFTTEPELLPLHKIQLILVPEKLDKKVWKVNISTMDLLEARREKEAEENQDIDERKSYDGQIHADADSIAAEE